MNPLWCTLALLAACATPRAKGTATPTAAPSCPEFSCPICPESECPQSTCPACPEPNPVSPPLASPQTDASDWYCMDLSSRRSKERTTFCWLSEKICQDKRKEARKKRMGRASPCQPQPVAYCVQMMERPIMSRQDLCMRTMDDCGDARKEALARTGHVSQCQPTLNTDPYTETRGFESRRAKSVP